MTSLCIVPSIFFGDKYDLIQLHRQNIHQNEKLSKITSIFCFKSKANNKKWLHVLFGLVFVPATSRAKSAKQLKMTLWRFLSLHRSWQLATKFIGY